MTRRQFQRMQRAGLAIVAVSVLVVILDLIAGLRWLAFIPLACIAVTAICMIRLSHVPLED